MHKDLVFNGARVVPCAESVTGYALTMMATDTQNTCQCILYAQDGICTMKHVYHYMRSRANLVPLNIVLCSSCNGDGTQHYTNAAPLEKRIQCACNWCGGMGKIPVTPQGKRLLPTCVKIWQAHARDTVMLHGVLYEVQSISSDGGMYLCRLVDQVTIVLARRSA